MTFIRIAAALILAVLLASCTAAPPQLRQYILASQTCERAPGQKPYLPTPLVIEPPVLAPHLDQAGLIRVLSDNSLHLTQTHLWAGPLDQLIATTLAENISSMFTGSPALTAPLPLSVASRFHLVVQVAHFEAWNGMFSAAGTWMLTDQHTPGPPQVHRYNYRVPLDNTANEHYVAQASTALAQLGCDIAHALQETITNINGRTP